MLRLLYSSDFAPKRIDEFVRSWQRAPFFEVPPLVYGVYQGADDLFRVSVGDAERGKPLPYDDLVLMPHQDDLPTHQAFVRLAAPVHAARLLIDSPTLLRGMRETMARHVTHSVAAVYLVSPHGVHSPLLILFGYAEGGADIAFEVLGDWNDARRMEWTAQHMATIINNSVSFLLRSPKQLVERRPAAPRTGAKTHRLKPWLRDDLASIILLDPDEAAAVGHRRDAPGDPLRHPRPHSRRGHVRILERDEHGGVLRKTYVRPSWIGPRQWEFAGSYYKVLGA